MGIVSSLSEQSYRKHVIPYTLWITEAWRVLGWAEPSAALFWEMATMYHTLYLAGRAYATDYRDPQQIPPILSCGSQSSMGSGSTLTVSEHKKKFSSAASAKELPVWLVGTFLLLHCEETAVARNLSGHDERRFYGNPSTVDSYSAGKVDFRSLLQHPALSPRYEATVP
jgi:TBCC domain-containing protein 1